MSVDTGRYLIFRCRQTVCVKIVEKQKLSKVWLDCSTNLC